MEIENIIFRKQEEQTNMDNYEELAVFYFKTPS